MAEDQYTINGNVPGQAAFEAALNGWLERGHRITEVAFNDASFVLISGSLAWYSANLPEEMKSALFDRRASKRQVTKVQFGDSGLGEYDRWLVVADQWFASSGLDQTMINEMERFQKNAWSMDKLILGLGDNYVIYGDESVSVASTAENLEYGYSGGQNLFEKMDSLNIAGMAVGIIENNQLTSVRGYGTRDADTGRAVFAKTPFDTASLSKYVGALTMMKLVQAGDINLNTDAKDLANPGTPIGDWRDMVEADPDLYGVSAFLPWGLTLERLLSHTASLVPGGSSSFTNWPGMDPTRLDLLLGYQCNPACGYTNTVWYDPDLGLPGTNWQYAGAGYLLAEIACEQLTGQDFADLTETLVLDPLGMENSTFRQPLSPGFEARSSKWHDTNGNAVDHPHYPWQTAGGLFASAQDYLMVMIPLLNEGRDRHGNNFLQDSLVDEMLLDRVPGSGTWGLGVNISQNQVDETSGFFSHNGIHSGARTNMAGSPSMDSGIVVLINNGMNAADSFALEIIAKFRALQGW